MDHKNVAKERDAVFSLAGSHIIVLTRSAIIEEPVSAFLKKSLLCIANRHWGKFTNAETIVLNFVQPQSRSGREGFTQSKLSDI